MGFKKAFLNKGWAGKTISREETVERINPIIRRHYELNHAYDAAIRRMNDREAAEQLNDFQKTARADIGKLSETVLSAGGASYNGTELEPDDYDREDSDQAFAEELRKLESEFDSMLSEELDLEHQIRTRAILGAVHANSQARSEYLRGLANTLR